MIPRRREIGLALCVGNFQLASEIIRETTGNTVIFTEKPKIPESDMMKIIKLSNEDLPAKTVDEVFVEYKKDPKAKIPFYEGLNKKRKKH